jgi:ATP-binding cassette subfamily B protein
MTALLATYVRPEMPRALLVGVFLLGGVGLQLLGPQVLRQFIDQATGADPTGAIEQTALLFLGLAIVQQLVGVGLNYSGDDLGWRTTNRLRDDLTRHCLRLGMPFHGARTPGEMVERIDGDATTLAEVFSRFAASVLSSVLLLIGVLVLLFLEDWRIGLGYSVAALVALLILFRLRDVAVPAVTAEREASARLYGFLEERLAGLDDVRSRGAGAWVLRGLAAASREMYRRRMGARLRETGVTFSYIAYITLVRVSALVVGAVGVSTGAATIGTAYLLYRYMDMLGGPISRLVDNGTELQRAKAGMARVRELLETEPPTDRGTEALPAGPLSVELGGVSFGYAADTPVLRDVSFVLPAGRVLGLVGRTGAGKTTVSRLLFRLYEPDAGVVRVGGVDVRRVRRGHLRSRVALVTQEVQLFRASLRDNVTLFDRDVPDARVLAALDELGLREWAAARGGLDAEVDPRAMSAGEAQLVAFARAFLKDPGLVILDEASSRLDPHTERLLERAVDRLLEGRTAVVIAHRPSTLRRADEVLAVEGGRLRRAEMPA